MELSVVCGNLFGIYNITRKVCSMYPFFIFDAKVPPSLPFVVFVTQVYNTVYSAYVINYYMNHISVDLTLNNMSLVVIITNTILLGFAIFSNYYKKNKQH
jgi:hypothetical protein